MSDINDTAISNAKVKIAEFSCRKGTQTSEFKGKTGVQMLMVLVMVLNRIGVDVQLDDQTALLIIGGLEAAYSFGRSVLKGFQTRSISDPKGSTSTVVHNTTPPAVNVGSGTIPKGASS